MASQVLVPEAEPTQLREVVGLSLQAVLDAVDEALLVIDADRRLVAANRRVWELFGMKPARGLAEIRSHIMSCVVDPEAYLLAIEEAGDDDVLQFELFRPRALTVRRCVSRLQDAAGRPAGWVVSYRDITRDAEVNRLKSEFVANVSHELRTPMAAIRGFIGVVLDDRDTLRPDQLDHFLTIALKETDRLSRLIDDLLDISRIESGRYSSHPVRFEVAELLREVAATVQPEAREAELRFDVFTPRAGEAWFGDKDQIRQVLLNLLSNAVKFTSAGGSVSLTAAVSRGELVLEVADTGCGIAADELPHIFDKFYRCRRSRASYRGTGLGLAIARELTEAHGGRITVTSELGAGTTFTVTMPRRVDEEI